MSKKYKTDRILTSEEAEEFLEELERGEFADMILDMRNMIEELSVDNFALKQSISELYCEMMEMESKLRVAYDHAKKKEKQSK